LTSPPTTAAEGGNAEFTLTLAGATTTRNLRVGWQVAFPAASSTVNPAEAADFAQTSGAVNFASGSAAGATQSIRIGLRQDALNEATRRGNCA